MTDWNKFINFIVEQQTKMSSRTKQTMLSEANDYATLLKQYNDIENQREKLRLQRNKVAVRLKQMQSALRTSMKLVRSEDDPAFGALIYNDQEWKIKELRPDGKGGGPRTRVVPPNERRGVEVPHGINAIRLKIASTNGKWNPYREPTWKEPNVIGPEWWEQQ